MVQDLTFYTKKTKLRKCKSMNAEDTKTQKVISIMAAVTFVLYFIAAVLNYTGII